MGDRHCGFPGSIDFNIAQGDGSLSSTGSGGTESYEVSLTTGDIYKFGVWRQGMDDPAQSSIDGVTELSLTLAEAVTNLAPIAEAGNNQDVGAGAQVTLDGTGSSDPDAGDSITYSWMQQSGTTVTLTGTDTATPGFNAPYTTSTHELVFELTVSDGTLSATDTVTVNVAASVGSFDMPHVLSDPLNVTDFSILNLMRPGRARRGDSRWQDIVTFFEFTPPEGSSGSWTISIDSTPTRVDFELAEYDRDPHNTGGGGDASYSQNLTAGTPYKFAVWRYGRSATQSSTDRATELTVTLTPPSSQ